MRKKIILTIVMLLLILGVQLSADQENAGLKGFIKYLNVNQDTLGFSSYGLLEHSDRIEVKIYLLKDKVEALKTIIKKYNYSSVNYDLDLNSGSQDAVITVSFAKSSEKASTQDVSMVDKKIKKEETKRVNKKDIVVKKVIEDKGLSIEDKKDSPKEKKKCPRRVKVQVAPVTVKLFNIYKGFSLPVIPSNEMEVKTENGGMVSEILVENGSSVEEGQLFLKFDSKKIQDELSELNTKLKNWKTNLFKRERWKVKSPRAVENAKNIIADTEKQIDEKEKELAALGLSVQMAGTIFHNISVEDSIDQDSVIAKIINSKKMRILIPASDENLFNINDMINLKFKNISELYSGRVMSLESGLMIEIENSNNMLSKGMTATFKVIKEVVTDAVVINSGWILADENGSFVFVVNDKRTQKVYITIKATDEIKKESLIQSGLLKEDEIILTNVDCLVDKKKIKIMVIDNETGKLVKRKKKKSKIKTEDIKAREIKKIAKVDRTSVTKVETVSGNFFKLSLGAGYHYIADSVFSEIYGNGLVSGRFEVSYTIKDKFEIFLASDYISKKGNFTGLKEDVSLNMIPMYFGGKYNFQTKGKFKPFLGLAFTAYAVKEQSDIEETSYLTDYGASLMVGVNMTIKPKLDLFFHLKYDMIKLTVEVLEDEKLDISGASLFIGASFKF